MAAVSTRIHRLAPALSFTTTYLPLHQQALGHRLARGRVLWRPVKRLGGDHLPALRRQFGAVAGALDHHLVRSIRQAVQGGVAEDRIVEESQPFVHTAVAGESEALRR